MSKVVLGARLILGTLFFVFGLNGFFNFIAAPEMTAEGGAFIGALAATGYMFPLIKVTEITAGLTLLTGRFVPFGLTILAPITINILAFHIFLEPASGLPMAIVIVLLQVFLAYAYRDSFAGVLSSGAKPAGAKQLSHSHA